MEYVEGRVIDPLVEPAYIERIARALAHLATVGGYVSGNLNGGPLRGLLVPDTEDFAFNSLEAMEKWFNSRLFPHEPKMSLKGYELVLCHLDIAPRNTPWREDGCICLVDWASADFYPRLFEFCTQWIIQGKEDKFNKLILDSMESLLEHELAQAEPVLRAWRNFQKYYL